MVGEFKNLQCGVNNLPWQSIATLAHVEGQGFIACFAQQWLGQHVVRSMEQVASHGSQSLSGPLGQLHKVINVHVCVGDRTSKRGV